MTTHILNFGYTTGQTLTAQLFALGSDTVAATASSVTEATNRKGRYAATFSDTDAGDYLLIYFLGGTAAGSEYFTVVGTDGESLLPWSEQGPLGYEPARQETVEEVLGAVEGIGIEAIHVPSPNVSGNLVLVSDDTYDGIGQPKASWSVGTDYTDGWSVMLTIRDRDDVVVLEVAGEVVSETLVSVAFTCPSDLEFEGCPGRWQGKFDVQLSKGDSRKTIAVGACYVTEDQTR